jgi:hypothetical protein
MDDPTGWYVFLKYSLALATLDLAVPTLHPREDLKFDNKK